MFDGFLRTLIKILAACLVAGTIMAQLGITTEKLMRATGLSQERLFELAQQGMNWALPNLILGSLVILPVWFLVYLFRPPRPHVD